MRTENNKSAAASSPASLVYSKPESLVQDFASRGLVILSPESLGIPVEIHAEIYEQQKKAHQVHKTVSASSIPTILEVLNSPGLVSTCNQLVGKNWAIIPCMHCASFPSGGRDQHWHKDDNAPYNARKQRHHQAVQIEMLYYPQAVGIEMGPTATVPYSQYWGFNHEENHDNFAGADHLDFNYHISGMEREAASGPESRYNEEDIINARTAHDIRMKDAVTNTKWPLVQSFEAGPLRAGSIVIYSHNMFHRGNHRRDDWRTWGDNPRYMWRFWLYRTTEPTPQQTQQPEETSWNEVDPLTHIALTDATDDTTELWRYHNHWIRTGQAPPPRCEAVGMKPQDREKEAERLFAQLLLKNEENEPARIGAAYKLASIGDTALAVRFLSQALYTDRESVRRAATYGLIAVGPDATEAFLNATKSPIKWIRKAGVYGLGDAAHLSEKVWETVTTRLYQDTSVYVRSVAAGTLGCLGRRANGTGIGKALVPDCFEALLESLGKEENRLAMDKAQQRTIKFVRPTDECDICEGGGVDFGIDRFEPVRSAVRENALWSLVILSSHGAALAGKALEATLLVLRDVIHNDKNAICVGLAMDALNRIAHLHSQDAKEIPLIKNLQTEFRKILKDDAIQSWETMVRGGLKPKVLSGLQSTES